MISHFRRPSVFFLLSNIFLIEIFHFKAQQRKCIIKFLQFLSENGGKKVTELYTNNIERMQKARYVRVRALISFGFSTLYFRNCCELHSHTNISHQMNKSQNYQCCQLHKTQPIFKKAQYGNFMIFLLIRFYVKSILKNLEV